MKETIVLYPAPFKGHFPSMVELGKALLDHHHPARPPFSITIIISFPPYEAKLPDAYLSSVSATHPDISFLHLPTLSDIPPEVSSPTDLTFSTLEFVRLNNPALHTALSNMSHMCHVKALVLDLFCSASSCVAVSLGIPIYYYYTSGASRLVEVLYLPTVHTNIPHSMKDLDPDTIIEFPGVLPIRAGDFYHILIDRSSKAYDRCLETSCDMAQSAGLIMNTFDSFEVSAVKALKDGLCVTDGPTPPTYCVGPLIVTLDKDGDEERHGCLRWLGSQPSRSVVFLSFGSMGKFSSKQLKEMALGLERSGVRFIWVVRPPPLEDEAWQVISEPEPRVELFLPDGFLERTNERGFLVQSWAPQMAILNHSSVGGFVTHCGWNSILEAVCTGVPMLAWPLYAEQKFNRNYIVEEVGVALTVKESGDGFVTADELEERIVELMRTEKGEAVRERVLAMKEEAAAALSEGGSSWSALGELIWSIKQGPDELKGSDSVEVSTRT